MHTPSRWDKTVVGYYHRWRALIVYAKNEEEKAQRIEALFNEFWLETQEMANQRGLNLEDPNSLYDVLAEQNFKWNELASIFEKWNVHSYLPVDGFLNMWNAL
jgi:hypothetical protein